MKTILSENKKPNLSKLKSFGFVKTKSGWEYSENIMDGDFCLTVKISDEGIKTELREVETNEIYTLHLMEGAQGKYIGKVRSEYDAVIDKILKDCFEMSVFESEYSIKVLKYAKEKYNSDAEYLWEKFPRNAVCRRNDNHKWFLAILSVKADKLGFNNDEIIEVLDIRANKEDVPFLLKKDNIYPAYHMNKKSWITVILDGSMDFEMLCEMIDNSYILAKK